MIETILTGLMFPFLFFTMFFQSFLMLSLFEGKKKIKKEEHIQIKRYPEVTIAVPCWNEEKTLEKTVESLLALDYPKEKLHIIIIDDGSKDTTYAIAESLREKQERVGGSTIVVIKKENGGKHTAMNEALALCQTELFGCLDADSFVIHHSLKAIVSYFEAHSDVMAVTPSIQIKNPQTMVQRVQAVEYLMGAFLRKAYGELDAIQVTPGPFSIFKREVFDVIGPYKKAHNTEDFEITLRMHKHHMKIMNSHKGVVFTLGPATIRGFLRQHLRWARGFLENSIDYRFMFFKKEYGNFGMFTLPGAVIFVIYGIYVALYMLYGLLKYIHEAVSRLITIGVEVPHFRFDLFYMETSMLSFITMIMFTTFLFVLYIGRQLSDDKQELYKNFPFFFVLFPILVPLYLTRAVFDTLFSRNNEWILQDTKVIEGVTG